MLLLIIKWKATASSPYLNSNTSYVAINHIIIPTWEKCLENSNTSYVAINR